MSSAHSALRLSRDLLGPISHFDTLLNCSGSSLPTGAGQFNGSRDQLQALAGLE
jgi:hypothetical protein